jgi:glycosyltransferase involved in cell wall biosynthesis
MALTILSVAYALATVSADAAGGAEQILSALADIVEHGVTGFLVRDAAEMADAIGAVDTLSREVCRETARRRFSAERMAAEYLARYESLARADRHEARRAG